MVCQWYWFCAPQNNWSVCLSLTTSEQIIPSVFLWQTYFSALVQCVNTLLCMLVCFVLYRNLYIMLLCFSILLIPPDGLSVKCGWLWMCVVLFVCANIKRPIMVGLNSGCLWVWVYAVHQIIYNIANAYLHILMKFGCMPNRIRKRPLNMIWWIMFVNQLNPIRGLTAYL